MTAATGSATARPRVRLSRVRNVRDTSVALARHARAGAAMAARVRAGAVLGPTRVPWVLEQAQHGSRLAFASVLPGSSATAWSRSSTARIAAAVPPPADESPNRSNASRLSACEALRGSPSVPLVPSAASAASRASTAESPLVEAGQDRVCLIEAADREPQLAVRTGSRACSRTSSRAERSAGFHVARRPACARRSPRARTRSATRGGRRRNSTRTTATASAATIAVQRSATLTSPPRSGARGRKRPTPRAARRRAARVRRARTGTRCARRAAACAEAARS